jgi:serine/threonine protein kinase
MALAHVAAAAAHCKTAVNPADAPCTAGVTDKDGRFSAFAGRRMGPNGRYKLIGAVGQGAYGAVFRCEDMITGLELAVKVSSDPDADREREVLLGVARLGISSSIVNMVDYFTFKQGKFTQRCIVMENMAHSLADRMRAHWRLKTRFSMKEIQQVSYSLLEGLCQLQSIQGKKGVRPVIHADIKPTNIMYSRAADPFPRLIDFGLSQYADDVDLERDLATTWYRAPEVIIGLKRGTEMDVWAVGCVMLEMLQMSAPFQYDEDNLQDLLLEQIRRCGMPPAADYMKLSPYYDRFKELCNGIKNFETKFVVRETEAWMSKIRSPTPAEKEAAKDFVNLVRTMLRVDHRERITAFRALQHPFLAGMRSDDQRRSTAAVAWVKTHMSATTSWPRVACALARCHVHTLKALESLSAADNTILSLTRLEWDDFANARKTWREAQIAALTPAKPAAVPTRRPAAAAAAAATQPDPIVA